jgi:hypothetical protein
VATPPLSREKHAEIIRLTRMKWPIQKIADAIGVGTGTVHNYKNRPLPETHEMSTVEGNQWNISLPQTRIQTLEQLIEHCKIDLEVWEVERFVANKYETSAKNEKDEIVVTPMFQVKATLKRKVGVSDARQEIEQLKALAKSQMPKPTPIQRPAAATGYMLEMNIPDAHFGKLAWGEETGDANYDTKIADALFQEAYETLFSRTAHIPMYDEILIIVGNDFFQTERGHVCLQTDATRRPLWWAATE